MKPTTVQNLQNSTNPVMNQNQGSEGGYCKKNCPKFVYTKYEQRIKISNKYAQTKIEAHAINLRHVSPKNYHKIIDTQDIW